MNVLTGYILVPLIILVLGLLIRFKAPDRNALCGFRTARSVASERNWRIAQRLCGNIMIGIAALSALINVAVYYSGLYDNLSGSMAALFLLIPAILLVLSVPYINRKLPDA